MGKKPNAANITHGLAQLGGGSKKEGGDGMMKGLENIFKTGVEYGARMVLNDSRQSSESIGVSSILPLEDENSDRSGE